jgi:hypothetical protein
MAKIVDPDALRRGTEIIIHTDTKKIQLVPTGNLSDTSPASQSGVTLQAVYSKCKELWKTESDLNKLKFPFDAITPVKMDLVNGWDWYDATTKRLIRDGGWCLRDASGNSQEEYMGIVSLGGRFASSTDKGYYQQVFGFNQPFTYFYYSDEINEPVKIYGDANHGNVNYRNFFKIFLREQGKTYAQGNLLKDQNLPSLDYTVYKLPLVNAVDIKVTTPDETIETQHPFIDMTIDYIRGNRFETWISGGTYAVDDVVYNTFESPGRWWRCTSAIQGSSTPPHQDTSHWQRYPGERQIGTGYYAFNRIVNGAYGTLEQIYEFCQHELRSTLNINDDTLGENYGIIIGRLANKFCSFIGDVLETAPGVFIDNVQASDRVRINFYDITVDGGGLDEEGVPKASTKRTYPFVSAGKILFNDILQSDADAYYCMYFKEVPQGTFDTTSAIIVKDASGNDIKGSINGRSYVEFTFDYDFNNQGGRTPGTDANVVIVAIGLNTACWVMGEFTITRAVGLSFPLNAAKERNYANP